MSHKATTWLADIPAATVGPSEFRVLFHLCDCHNPSRGCFPTQAYLIANTGASNGTVNNALNALEAKGLIRRIRERDGKSKRQKPTRYVLAFEDEKPGDPSPEIGAGAVSNLDPDPSPISGPTRLQPTGEKPVSNQNINHGREREEVQKDAAAFWADSIKAGKSIPQTAVTLQMGRDMIRRGLVTAAQLAAQGIHV